MRLSISFFRLKIETLLVELAFEGKKKEHKANYAYFCNRANSASPVWCWSKVTINTSYTVWSTLLFWDVSAHCTLLTFIAGILWSTLVLEVSKVQPTK